MSAIETSSIATSSSRGFILGQTDGATVQQIFRNGASIGSPPITYGYFGMINLPIYVLGRNNEGVIAGASTDQIAAVSYGGMLTSTQATAFYNRLRTYLSALGVP
jgi:hypothetical protein